MSVSFSASLCLYVCLLLLCNSVSLLKLSKPLCHYLSFYISQPLYLSVYLFICLPLPPSLCISLLSFFLLSTFLFLYLYLSTCLSLDFKYNPLSLSFNLTLSISLSLSLSVIELILHSHIQRRIRPVLCDINHTFKMGHKWRLSNI